MDLVQQPEQNTGQKVNPAVGDSKYGTADNLAACVEKNIAPHLGVLADQQKTGAGRYDDPHLTHDATSDTDTCPAGQKLERRRYHQRRGTHEYAAAPGVCAACALREQCTDAQAGRTVQRRPDATAVSLGQQIARSPAAHQSRRRRWHLLEGSFGRAANEHGFKHSRWRRQWRQQIQDWLIAAVQNVKILLRDRDKPVASSAAAPRAMGKETVTVARGW